MWKTLRNLFRARYNVQITFRNAPPVYIQCYNMSVTYDGAGSISSLKWDVPNSSQILYLNLPDVVAITRVGRRP